MYDFYFGNKEQIKKNPKEFLIFCKRMLPRWINGIPDSECIAIFRTLNLVKSSKPILLETGCGASTLALFLYAVLNKGKVFSWDTNGSKGSFLRSVISEAICRPLEINLYEYWNFIGFDSTSEHAGIPLIKELNYKADFCFFDSWHTLEHLMKELKCFENVANEEFIVALDDAYYTKRSNNYAYLNMIRKKLDLRPVKEPKSNFCDPFYSVVQKYLNKKYQRVEKIDDSYKKEYGDDLFFRYFEADKLAMESLGMEKKRSLEHRYDCWKVNSVKHLDMNGVDVCVLCGSGDVHTITDKMRHEKIGTVVRCVKCDLARLMGAQKYEEKLDGFYEEQYALHYFLGVKSDASTLHKTFLPVQKDRVKKLAPYLHKTDKVLEVGSGTGYFLETIRNKVTEVQGIELNKNHAAYASEVLGIPTINKAHGNSDLPLAYYDHLCLFQVLEHATNPIKLIRELKPFLKTGGHLHIEVPNLLDPMVSFYDVEAYRNFFYQIPHLYYFTPETLAKICSKVTGLKPIKIFGFQQTSLINHLNWAFWGKPQKSRWDCIQPVLPEDFLGSDISEETKTTLNEILLDVDQRYKEFLESNNFSDNLFATFVVE
tara:strand:+ start:30987 stop:32780 length:1794 start_codon:yes stop_codon:yes gene_type:complete